MIKSNKHSSSYSNPATTPPQPSVRRSFLDLTHDAMVLAELQAKLAKQEAQQGFRGLVMPAVMILVAVIIGLGTAPVVLILIGEALIEFAGTGQTVAYSIATGIGMVVTLMIGLGGWIALRNRLAMFDRSVAELKQNVEWFKRVIGSNRTRDVNNN